MPSVSRTRYVRRLAAAGVVVTCAGAVLAGCSSSSSGASSGGSKTITVGLANILTGSETAFGIDGEGAIAYFKNVNAHGGTDGYTYKWIREDTAGSPAQAETVARNLVQQDHVDAVLADGTIPAEGIKTIAAALKVPIIAGADGDLFTNPVISNFYSVLPAYKNEGGLFLQYAKQQLGESTMALAYENDSIGQPFQASVPGWASKHGYDLVKSVGFPATTSDFSGYASALKASGAQAVLVSAATPGLAGMVKAMAAIGYNPTVFSSWEAIDPAYTALVGNLADKDIAIDFQLPLATKSASVTQYQNVVSKYYPKDVSSSFVEQGWNFAAIVDQAVKDTVKAGKPVTGENLVATMNTFTNLAIGTLPSVTYNSQEHYSTTRAYLYKVQNLGDGGVSASRASDLLTLPSS
jgi:branched-chain amino acid transport system substrate-binding protein